MLRDNAEVTIALTMLQVKGYEATQSALHEALEGAEIVLIPAGVPRKPGMTRDGKETLSWMLARQDGSS